MKQIRFLPLVAFSVLCLLVLKTAAMLFGANQLTGAASVQAQAVSPKKEPAKEDDASDKSADEKGKPQNAKVAATGNNKVKTARAGEQRAAIKYGPIQGVADGEMALLQSLVRRRRKIDAMREDLDLRQNLLKAAEKRIEARITELKAVEARINATLKQEKDIKSEQFSRLVKLYSGMKPKDAARIFNRLNMKVLVSLVQRMKARKVAPIMAAMNVDRAEALTRILANESGEMDNKAGPGALPAIQSGKAG